MLDRLVIQNFRRFGELDLKFDGNLNILVGDNDSGKSTIMQALEMVLSGRIGGRHLEGEISPHWFTLSVAEGYLTGVRNGWASEPPSISIEAFFCDDSALATYSGKNNSLAKDQPGIRLDIQLDSAYESEYQAYISQPEKVTSIPIEFYRIDRRDFSGQSVSGNRPLVTTALIDASTLRLQSGTDYYLRRSIDQHLTSDARAKLSLAFRSHREMLTQDPAFKSANESIDVERTTLKKKRLALSSDSSAKASWEASLVPHLDSVPFEQIGSGEQSVFKILLALDKDGAQRHVVMVEEPENHLSHSNLNSLILRIRERSRDQQLIITTHSSFVLNKLGIDKLRLLSEGGYSTMDDLTAETKEYFLKLAGYDTLRMVLAQAIILVEGPSDELVVQKAYCQKHGHMPLDDGIDVISVQALAFRRFLELGSCLNRKTAVITDLDDDLSDAKARRRFSDFETDRIRGFVGEVGKGKTLEPQLVSSAGLSCLNRVLGCEATSADELAKVMTDSKTDCALKLFASDEVITMPGYIEDAIEFVK